MVDAWKEMAGRIAACVACPELVATRSRVVVGDPPAYGAPGGPVRLAFVGEAPGPQEDAAGRPFVGKSGYLLDQLLTDSGLARAEAALLTVVKCRPPLASGARSPDTEPPGGRAGAWQVNRPPRQQEIARCQPYLRGQLDLLRPRLIVALGLTAAAWFLGRRTCMAEARGTVHRVDGRAVIATYHPTAAMRFGPNGAPLAALREDLDFAARVLAEAPS